MTRRRTTIRPLAAAGMAAALLAAGCRGRPATPAADGQAPVASSSPVRSSTMDSTRVPAARTTLALSSPAFASGGGIPRQYTCDGTDTSPALQWSGAPQGTASFALIVDDPDAPDPSAPRMTWVHWVVYDIPAAVTQLPEGATEATLPQGSRAGLNDWKRAVWGGPCPPIGRHRYFFKLYALDVPGLALDKPDKARLEAAMEGHILARAELMGTYQRGK